MAIRLTPRTELTEEELRIIEESKQKRTWVEEKEEVLQAIAEARRHGGPWKLEEKYPHWTEYQWRVVRSFIRADVKPDPQ